MPVKKQATTQPEEIAKPKIKVMRLADAGLNHEQQGNWIKVKDYFESEDSVYSQPFYITKARVTKSKEYGDQIVLTVEDAVGESNHYLTSLSANEERMEYVEFSRNNRDMWLGPVCFKRIPGNYGNDYIKIVDADEAEESEGD